MSRRPPPVADLDWLLPIPQQRFRPPDRECLRPIRSLSAREMTACRSVVKVGGLAVDLTPDGAHNSPTLHPRRFLPE